MRAAPAGLCGSELIEPDILGAEVAAITHGHPLGYIPAAVLAHITHTAAYRNDESADTLKNIVLDAMNGRVRYICRRYVSAGIKRPYR